MTSIQDRLMALKSALTEVTAKCYHYRRAANVKPGYIVWMETGESSDTWGDNRKSEQSINVAVDYFTQTEFDTTVDSIQAAFDGIACGWMLEAVQYEDETNLIHYTWSVNV